MTDNLSPHRFLDLSGYGFSGKHAVIDLVREFKGYHVPHFSREFDLLRIPGGIIELNAALTGEWSFIRSDAAIRRFKRVVRRLGVKHSWVRPWTWFAALGPAYDEYFNHRFLDLSEAYVDDLVTDSWSTSWPFPLAEVGAVELFWRKLFVKLGIPGGADFTVHLARPKQFLEITRRYLADVLSSNVEPGTRTIVIHNAFGAFSPERALDFFPGGKCIVVDRDPRDNYVQHLGYRPMQVPLDVFIRRYRIYREAAHDQDTGHPDVLRIHFEGLVLNYDRTIAQIIEHLGEGPAVHEHPRRYFDPTVSAKNIGLWKKHRDQSEIREIETELAEYCRDV